jgi:O-antigen/teichoic acid export membrane protein
MEYPSTLTVVTNLVRIALGTLALLAGWGIVGLAIVSLLVNCLNVVLFFVLTKRVLGLPRFEFQPGLLRRMVSDAYPLMLNHLLATVFFKIDSVLLKFFQGDVAVGYYGTAYKLVDGLQVIPSSFVFALFPVLSRRAGEGRDAVRRAYTAGLRLLVAIAMPISVATTFFAVPLIHVIGGQQYLPESAMALAALIWFLPFSFANGLTQYVLIAINQQRFITWSFVFATAFNLVANVAIIPRFGFMGAAVVTVLSELALMGPFLYCTKRHLGEVPVVGIFVRTGLAAAGMAVILWIGGRVGVTLLLTLPASGLVYLALLAATGAVTSEEIGAAAKYGRTRLARRRANRAVPASE